MMRAIITIILISIPYYFFALFPFCLTYVHMYEIHITSTMSYYGGYYVIWGEENGSFSFFYAVVFFKQTAEKKEMEKLIFCFIVSYIACG